MISLQITGVDIEPILANAGEYDTPANRRRKVRETLFRALGITDRGDLLASQGFVDHSFTWRGTRRSVDIIFDQVREIRGDRLPDREGIWTVVLGLPFDARPRADSFAAMADWPADRRVVVWQPAHLSDRAQRDLGRLIRVEEVLKGERFDEAARGFSMQDREQARAIIRNLQSQLQQRLQACLDAAYGIATEPRDALDAAIEPRSLLQPLEGTIELRAPFGASLGDAFSKLLDQLYGHSFPAHPQFEIEIRLPTLRRVHEVAAAAIGTPDGRIPVPERPVRELVLAVANPLRLGTMGSTHFALGHDWQSRLDRLHAQRDETITVGRLRRWMDEPEVMGLPAEVQNLIILTYAGQTNRSFLRNGVSVSATLERIDDDFELLEQALPQEADWLEARWRAEKLFGIAQAEVRNAQNVARLADLARDRLKALRRPLADLGRALEQRLQAMGIGADRADRLVTARSAMALDADLDAAADATDVVTRLAKGHFRTSIDAIERTIASATSVLAALDSDAWVTVEALDRLADHRRSTADAIRRELAEALAADEYNKPLAMAVNEARARALRLLTEVPASPGPRTEQSFRRQQPPPASEIVDQFEGADLQSAEAISQLRKLVSMLEQDPELELSLTWQLTRRRPT
jgi:hypothetical protein